MKKYLREDFTNSGLSPNLHWLNEPEKWVIKPGRLVISPGKTDFWARTHYGFIYDNGHFLFHKSTGNFILTTKVRDQAGLMVRINEGFWLKTSVEFENENLSRLGVVVTNFGFSDWSTQDFDPEIQEMELKIEKDGMDYMVYYKTKHWSWSQMRITHIHKETATVQCGIYACCPVDTGFQAEFEYLEIQYQ